MQASAYDFSAVAHDYWQDMLYEIELYYTINQDGKTVTVTNGPAVYEGVRVNIPETVEHEGVTYTVTAIGYQAFANSNVNLVIMPNTIEEVQSYAFSESKVDSVSFSKGLKYIRDYAFNGARLRRVVLHDGVESLGVCAFADYTGYANNARLISISLPNSITEIGEMCFLQQDLLPSIELPECLKEIKEKTFSGCYGLTEVLLPTNVEKIGRQAFGHCPIKSIEFPSALVEIGEEAFASCELSEVVLPDNVTTLGKGVFTGCHSLEKIVFSKGMKAIPEDACGYCEQLVDVSIPEGISAVGLGAFYECTRLSHVTFPESVVDLGAQIFYSSGIASFEFPKSMTVIPQGMFGECDYLTEITIPSTITTIGGGAFRYCDNLSVVNIAESVTRIEGSAFDYCKSLKEIILPAQLNFIGERAFGDCDSLEKIEIPSKVNKIEEYAFANCDLLKEIIIPHETAIVGQYMLSGCPNLESVHYQRAILPGIDGLANYPKIVDANNNCTLYVPRGAKATYEASAVWNNFMAIEEEDVPNVYYELSAKVVKGSGSVLIGEENIVYNKVDTLLGSAVTVVFTPADGYMVEVVLCNGEDITAELSETLQYEIASVEANYVFEVYYKERPVALHLVSGQGGSIDLTIEKGARFTCNFKPEEGWRVNTVLFNGRDVTAEWSEADGYTTPQLTAESTLSVSFELMNSIVNQVSSRMKAYSKERGVLTIEGLTAGEQIDIYTADGKLMESVESPSTMVTVELPADAVYVVTAASGTIKVGM